MTTSAGKCSREEIEEIEQEIRKENKYVFEVSYLRNVLMLGRCKSGKTTAVGVLKTPIYQPKSDQIVFADSADVRYETFCLDATDTLTKYSINIIDAPGLKEVRKQSEADQVRTDKIILKSIKECLEHEICHVNALLIFLSVADGIKPVDIDCFQQYTDSFYHGEVPIIICITRFEDKGEEQKKMIIEKLRKQSYFSGLLARPNVSISFLGAVDDHSLRTKCKEDLEDLYSNVLTMREELLSKIFQAEGQISLLDLPATLAPMKRAVKLVSDQLERAAALLEERDAESESAAALIEDMKTAHLELKSIGVISFASDGDLRRKSAQFQTLAVDVANLFRDPDTKAKFVRDFGLERLM